MKIYRLLLLLSSWAHKLTALNVAILLTCLIAVALVGYAVYLCRKEEKGLKLAACLMLWIGAVSLCAFQTHVFPALDTNNSFTGSNTFSGVAIPAIGLDPLAAPYNCKFDGVTDDSSCLQAAMTAAINANSCLILPAGQTAVFATTLTANVTQHGLCMRGKGLQPSISGHSTLKYTGSGTTAISMSNSNSFIYGVNWDSVVIMAGANATNAVNAVDISEFAFHNVGIFDDGTHKFTNGWNCQGCNIGTWDRWIVANVTNAVVLVDTPQSPSASLTFIHADTFQVTNVFAISGQGNNISDIAGWHETQNVVLLIDDTTNTTSLQSVYFDNTRVLFNGAIASFPDSVLLKVNNVAGKVMVLHQMDFDHIAYNTNQAVPYPYVVNLANASSIVWMGIGGNSSHQGATTGLINTSLAGGTSALRLNVHGMESLNASLSPLSTLVAGTGALFTDLEFGGLTSNGNVTLNAATSFIALGTSPSTSGLVRLSNNNAITSNNAAGNANLNLAYIGTDNKVHLGQATVVDTGGLTFTGSNFINMLESTSPGGVAGNEICYPDSTLHALKCNYNNVGYFQMAQVITATSAAFATATTAGTCVQSTTAVTGATTAMTVSVSPVSAPGVGAVWSAFVSSAGNITINECAVAASAGGTIAFNIRVTP